MKRKGLLGCVTALLYMMIAPHAWARLGETPAQCDRRYGAPTGSLPPEGDIVDVRLYRKDDVHVTVLFRRKPGRGDTACCIAYAPYPPGSLHSFTPPFTDAQVKALLATVPGRWEDYGEPDGLKRTQAVAKTVGHPGGITGQRRDEVARMLESYGKATVRLFLPSPTTLSDLGHNGLSHFAFLVARQVVIATHDAASDIEAWSKAQIERAKQTAEKEEKPLSGF
jgi:hypothetical protein